MPKRAPQTALLGKHHGPFGKIKIPNGRWCYALSVVIPAVPSAVLRVEWDSSRGTRTARPEPEPCMTAALVAAVRVR